MSYKTIVVADLPKRYAQLGESSGTVAVDAMGIQNGTHSSVTLGQTGAIPTLSSVTEGGYAASYLDASNSVTSFPDASDLDFTTAFTLEAWVYPTFRPGTANTIIGKWGASLNQRSYWLVHNNVGTVSLQISTGGSSATFSTTTIATLTLNTWTHVVGVYSSGTLRIYLNSVQNGTPTSTGGVSCFSGSEPLKIGNITGAPFNATWNGLLDEAAVYDYALSPTQISTHYTTGTYQPKFMRFSILPDDGSTHGLPVSPNSVTIDGNLGSGVVDVTVTSPFIGGTHVWYLLTFSNPDDIPGNLNLNDVDFNNGVGGGDAVASASSGPAGYTGVVNRGDNWIIWIQLDASAAGTYYDTWQFFDSTGGEWNFRVAYTLTGGSRRRRYGNSPAD